MATKQIRVSYHAKKLSLEDIVLTVQVNNVQVFDGVINETADLRPNQPTGVEYFMFDIELPKLVRNDPTPKINVPVQVTVQNGSLILKGWYQNFVRKGETKETFASGSADVWNGPCWIASQPTWNDVTDTTLYNFESHFENGQPGSPGELRMQSGDIVKFDLEVNKFNDQQDGWPLPESW